MYQGQRGEHEAGESDPAGWHAQRVVPLGEGRPRCCGDCPRILRVVVASRCVCVCVCEREREREKECEREGEMEEERESMRE